MALARDFADPARGNRLGSPADTDSLVQMARAKSTQAKRAAAREDTGKDKIVASNRRARHDYDLLDSYECGIVLQGSEVKSLREGKAQLSDAYARVVDGEMWLFGLHIPPWQFAQGFGAHDPDRKRKLLLHRSQIDELLGKTTQQALTLVPTSLYFKEGKAKVALALAKGRRLHDKRRVIAERDAEREVERAVRGAARWG
jgi:SsrA-binding protein